MTTSTLKNSIKCRPFYSKDTEALDYCLDTLYEDINQQNYNNGGGLCEFIKGSNNIRFYIDLDCKNIASEEQLKEEEHNFKMAIAKIKSFIRETFNPAGKDPASFPIRVASYMGKQYEEKNFKSIETDFFKLSAHLIFPTLILSMDKAPILFNKIKSNLEQDKAKYLDGSVYGNNRSIFRLPFAKKGNCSQVMTLQYDVSKYDISDFVITWFNKNDPNLVYPEIEMPPQTITEKPLILRKNDLKNGISFKNEWLDAIRPILLEVLPLEDIDNYKIWFEQIGQGLFNMFKEDGKELFREVSMRSLEKYDAISFEDNWAKYQKSYDPERINKKMWGGILDLAKQRNPNHKATKDLEALAKKELLESRKKARQADKEQKEAELMDLEDILEWIKEKSQGNIIIKADKTGKDISYFTYSEDLGYWRQDTLYCKTYIKSLLVALAEEKQNGFYKLGKTRTAVEQDLHTIFRNEEIIFDNISHFLPFQNGILNLLNGDFIPHDKKYYITLVLPYAFEKLNDQQIENSHIWKMINKIFVEEDIKRFALACYATSLIGENIQHIFLCSGKGGNGKGVLNRLNASALENYSIKGSSAILTSEKRTGACPEMANLANKRFAVFQEVEGGHGFENAVLKDLTGGDKIDARGLYDSNTNKKNAMSLFIESNDVPKLKRPPQDAEKRRFKMIEFKSHFSKNITKDDWDSRKFLADDSVDTDEYRQRYRNTWINILLPFAIEYLKTRSIDTPKSAKDAINKYFISCDNITEFLDMITIEGTEKDVIGLKSIYTDIFKNHEAYHKLGTVQQRKSTYQHFIKSVEKSSVYGSAYRDNTDKKGGIQSHKIIGYKLRPYDDYKDFLINQSKNIENPLLLDD
jgi:P4 family phage/plasmid primase-like protien